MVLQNHKSWRSIHADIITNSEQQNMHIKRLRRKCRLMKRLLLNPWYDNIFDKSQKDPWKSFSRLMIWLLFHTIFTTQKFRSSKALAKFGLSKCPGWQNFGLKKSRWLMKSSKVLFRVQLGPAWSNHAHF